MHRRPFIEAVCTAAAAGTIAGCLDSEDADDPGNGDPTDNESEGDDPTENESGNDDTADGNGTDDGDASDNDTDDGGGSNESEDDTGDDGDGEDDDVNETDGDDSAGENESDDGDDEEPVDDPEVTIETLETDCAGAEGGGDEGGEQENESEGDGDGGETGDADRATIEATDEGATIRGTVGSPTPCYEARVVESEVADGELRVRIGVEAEDTDLCMECLGAVEYEATVAGDVDRIVVEHERIEEEPTEVAEAGLEN